MKKRHGNEPFDNDDEGTGGAKPFDSSSSTGSTSSSQSAFPGSGERRFGPSEIHNVDLENEAQSFSALDVLYAQGLAMAETIVDRALTDNARDDAGVRGLFSRMHGPAEGVRHGDRESLRDHLVLLHAPLVEHCARNFMASGEPLDDLVQEGYVGLIKAVDRFDPSKGVRFSTYACHMITGEIRHYLRDLGRLIHEPGWHFELRQRINRTNDQLTQQLGRPPEPEDIARHLNIAPNTVRDVLRNSQVLAVEFLDAEGDRDDEDGRGGFDWDQKLSNPNHASGRSETRVEDQMMLGEALPQLRDLEKRAVTLFFFEDKTKTEIARQLGISVNHAAYLIKRGVEGLRNIIETSDVAAAAVEDLNSALWDKSAMQRRTRAAYLLELTKGAVKDEAPPAVEAAPVKARRGRPARRVAQVAQVVPPTAVPASRLGIIRFTEFVTAVDDEVRRAARYGGEFSLLWLRIQNWDEVLALHEGEEKRAITALQTLTRRACRSTDKIAMFSTGELPGLHFGILMPHTGATGEKTGQRWLKTCQSATVFPEEAKSADEILRTDIAFAVFPQNGKSADALFTHLGQQLQAAQDEPQAKGSTLN
jgi:RNA polymerase sigma-B factor